MGLSLTRLRDNVVLEINDSYTAFTGYTREEIIGHKVNDIDIWVNPKDRERMLTMMKERGRVSNEEFYLRVKSGEVHPVLMSAERINIGGEECLLVMALDISERKQAEDELKESEQFTSSLLQGTPHQVIVLNPDRSIKYVNPAFEKLTGFTIADVIGNSAPYPWWPKETEVKIAATLKHTSFKDNLKKEMTYQKKNGEHFRVEVTATSIMKNEERKYILINWVDITERKKAEEALKDSEAKYASLVENSSDGIIIIQDRVVKYINSKMVEVYGYPKEEVIGKQFVNIIAEEQREMVSTLNRKRLAGEEAAQKYEFDIINKKGERLNMEINASQIEFQGRPADMATIRDITGRKRAEEALRDSEEKFSKAFNSSNTAICITSLTDGKFLEINEGFSRFTGYTREEAIGHTATELKLWSNPEEFKRIQINPENEGKFTNIEFHSRMKSGEIRVGLSSSEVINIGGKECRIVVITDITERKKAEEALKNSEEKFIKVFHANPNPLCIASIEGETFIDVNDSYLRFTGYTREETIGRTSAELGLWENEDDLKTMRSILMQKRRIFNHQFASRVKSGELKTILFSTEIINIAGKMCAVIAITDITERKKAEEALKDSEEKFSKAFNSSAIAICISSLKDGRIVDVNASSTRFTGYSREELIGHTAMEVGLWGDLIDPKLMQMIIENKGIFSNLEYPSRMKSGEIRIGLTSSDAITIKGEPCIISVTADITERKEMEGKLKVFSQAVENAYDSFVLTDMNGNITYANESANKIFNYSAEEMVKLNVAQFVENPEDVKNIIKEIEMKGFWSGETAAIRKNKDKFSVNLSISLVKDADGKSLKMLGVFRDITERKKAEEALKDSEEKFSRAFNSSANAVCIVSLTDNKYVEINDSFCRFTGYTRKEIIGHTAEELKLWVNQDDWKKLQDSIKKEGRFDNFEFQSRMKSGEIRMGLSSAEVINIAGKPCRIVVITDITERKKVEEALKESEEFNSTLLTNTPDAIFVTYPDGTIKYANPAFEKLTGFTLAEIVGIKIPYPWWPGDKKDEIRASLQESPQDEGINLGEQLTKQMTFQKKNGEPFTVELNAKIINKNGQRQYILVTWIDITERKKAEEALKDSEEKFSKAFSSSANAIGITNIKENRFIEANESFLRFTGYSREEIIGHSASELNLWVNEEEAETWLKTLQKDGRVFNQEFSSRMKSGEVLIGLASAEVISIGGERCRIISITDITERKQAEEALKHSEENFRHSLDDSPLGIRIVNSCGEPVYINQSLLEIYGFSSIEEYNSRPIEKRFTPGKYLEHERIVQKMANNEFIPKSGETSIVRKDGEVRHLEVLIKDIVWNGEKQYQLLYQDITERKKAEEKLKEAMSHLEQSSARLEAANKELEAFSYSVSHDLRSPLRSIDGFSQALLEDYAGNIDTNGQDYLKRLRNASQKMGELIDGLLRLSRLSRSELHREPLDLSTLALEISTRLRETQPERNVEFIISGDLAADGDPQLLRALLENLLGNAWKFTSKVTDASIEFGSTLSNEQKTFYVKDNGAGFDMTYVDKLFGAFQRLHDNTEFPGTGIGLATVRRIVNRHGGMVRAEGAVGKGATFYFTLG